MPSLAPQILQALRQRGGVVSAAELQAALGVSQPTVSRALAPLLQAGELLKVGAAYPGCRIELPGVGVLELTLSIQSLFEVTLKNGSKSFRSGCQFVNLHPSMESLLQRYILKLERDRINSMPR